MYLCLIFFKFGTQRLAKGNAHTGNGMVVRSTLQSGEERLFDWLFQIVRNGTFGRFLIADAVENHARSRATQRLVGGGGDNVT